MSEIQELDICVDSSGVITIQVSGKEGKSVLDLTKPLFESLDGILLEHNTDCNYKVRPDNNTQSNLNIQNAGL